MSFIGDNNEKLTGLNGLHVPLESAACSSFEEIEPDLSVSTLSDRENNFRGIAVTSQRLTFEKFVEETHRWVRLVPSSGKSAV